MRHLGVTLGVIAAVGLAAPVASGGVVGGEPANDFAFGKVTKNKRKGTAKLPVSVAAPPGALELAATGKVKGATERVDARATARLPIRPTQDVKERLADRGKARVLAEVTYTPDATGEPNTKSKRIRLKMRLPG